MVKLYNTPGEVCLAITCSVHTHAGVLEHQIWCASTVPPGTPNMVFIAHPQVLCPEWQIYWSALHTHCGVVLTDCASDTAVNTVHTRYSHKIQCAMHLKITFKYNDTRNQ